MGTQRLNASGQSTMDWVNLRNGLLKELKESGYSQSSLDNYRRVLNRLVQFAGRESPSLNVIEQFLSSKGLPPNAAETCGFNNIKHHRLVLLVVRVFIQYARKHSFFFIPHKKANLLPDGLDNLLYDYKCYCAQYRRYRHSTLDSRIPQVRKFLRFVLSRNGVRIEDIRAEDLSKFIQSLRHMAPRTVATNVSTLRMFLHYLWVFEIIPKDLSLILPEVRIYQDVQIPLVWSKNEINAILSTVNRNTPKGKRDYAILLLASQLGLRSKDIRELKFENLHWPESRIVITQSKTGALLALPILEDVGEAIIEYLQNGRPESSYREIFLRARPPYKPLVSGSALCYILGSYRKQAGIPIPDYGHIGIHSLRYTLASRLLENETRLDIISNILGHTSSESTHIYTKVDIESLRTASLNPDIVNQ